MCIRDRTTDLLERTRKPFNDVIAEAGVKVSDIAHVVLVGGSTRMPAVTELVKQLTGGREPNKGVNPDEVVAVGAALQAGVPVSYTPLDVYKRQRQCRGRAGRLHGAR